MPITSHRAILVYSMTLLLVACGGGGGSADTSTDSFTREPAVGPAGEQGIQGEPGPMGPAGPEGPKGDTGANGPAGIPGAPGSQGPVGPQGEQGIAGTSTMHWQGVWVESTSYETGDVISFDGRAFISIQSTTGIEDPNDTAYWELLVDKGSDGAQGGTGLQGEQGDAGLQGIQGIQGEAGLQGPQGVAGVAGPQGVAGPPGVAGPTGATGAAGEKGDTGDAGPRGMTWQGSWESAVAYAQDDAVSYNGGSYIATIGTSPGISPESAVFWEALVEPSGGNEIVYEFVGYSSATLLPGAGRYSLNAACETDFGANARVARSDEIVFSGGAPSGTGKAWYESYTGRDSTVINAGSDCSAWMIGTTGASGRTLDRATGQYSNELCSSSLVVACSKPIVVTAPMSFKGFTSATVQPGAGRFAMNAACEVDYGAGARIARSDEIVFSGGAPSGTGTAWYESYTGRDSTVINSGSDCSAWMLGTSGASGRTIDIATGQYGNEFCNAALNVACSSR